MGPLRKGVSNFKKRKFLDQRREQAKGGEK